MLSLRKLEKRPGSLALVEQPVPEPGAGEVLLKVAACGVCGSDLHAYREDPGYESVIAPVTLGHEFAGSIAALGPGVTGWREGQAVSAVATLACGVCLPCRDGALHLCAERKVQGLHADGGMAEYVKVAARNLVPLPDGLDLRTASLVEPLSVALHAVHDRTDILPGDFVVVTGPGIIGLLCALTARLRGAQVAVAGTAVDLASRLPAAERLGLQCLLVGERPLAAQLSRRPDVVIEASGSPQALSGALDAVRRGGAVTVVGLYAEPVTWFMTTAVREELTIRCSYGAAYRHYVTATALLHGGQIPGAALIDPYPLAEGVTAFADALARKSVKPVLIPPVHDR